MTGADVVQRWRVTALLVIVPAVNWHGKQMVYQYHGAFLPQGVPADTIAHLVRKDMIEAVTDAGQ